ncbi:unnamed protein product [Lymnaea stagnalis]|uniref:Uncharacterized protein n=1 Tax=Lymnaea stagnalis TaxID=6523 RepID=A0AAV2HYZ2_LYMST
MSIEPTSHFNVDTIISPSGQKYLVYDLAGNIGYRLRPFLDGTNGVIYLLGTRGENFLLEREQNNIKQLLQERDLENVPVLFVVRDGTYTNDLSSNLPEKLRTALEGRLWEVIEIRQNSQEDADLVLSVLEKLLIKPEQLATS